MEQQRRNPKAQKGPGKSRPQRGEGDAGPYEKPPYQQYHKSEDQPVMEQQRRDAKAQKGPGKSRPQRSEGDAGPYEKPPYQQYHRSEDQPVMEQQRKDPKAQKGPGKSRPQRGEGDAGPYEKPSYEQYHRSEDQPVMEQQRKDPKAQKGPGKSKRHRGEGDAGPIGAQQAQVFEPTDSGETSLMASMSISPKRYQQEGTDLLSLIPAREDCLQEPKVGKKMSVFVNFFPIVLKKRGVIVHQYDVTIEPDKPKYMLRPAWNEFVRRNFPEKHPSFDGKKIAVSARPLLEGTEKKDTFEVYNEENGKNKEFTVTIKLASKVELDKLMDYMKSKDLKLKKPSNVLAFLDIALRNNCANTFIQVGRSFFSPPKGQIISLGNGLEMWYGMYQSAVLGWKPYLNLDVAHKGFPEAKNVVDTIANVCLRGRRPDRNTQLQPREIDDLGKYLKSLKVEYKLPHDQSSKRVYKVNGVNRLPASREEFLLDNTKTNVVEYFAKHKNYIVKYPQLPCLWVGSLNNKIYVPPELCTVIQGQSKMMKLDPFQTREMIRNAAKPPDERAKMIINKFDEARFENDFTREFGISVAGEFERVDARVLNAPSLDLGLQGAVSVKNGQWNGDQFLRGASLEKWCVLNLDDWKCSKYVVPFIEAIGKCASEMKMSVKPPMPCLQCKPEDKRQITEILLHCQSKSVDIVFVLIPDKGTVYSSVKRISEIEIGVLTQCVKSSTVEKSLIRGVNKSTFFNILRKVNAKLNGINHTLFSNSRPKCLLEPIMIVGADVTHPAPDARDTPSVAAVAASHDPKAFLYNTIRRLQPPTKEVIQNFDEIIKAQLIYFYRKTNYKPRRIIVFRDGVSEGQFPEILREEVMAIKRACKSLSQDYEPLITFIVVQKRHHTRFFPEARTDPRNKNVPAGTCVDTKIIDPRDVDFYLVSHNSPLGTARPTKYRLLYDDSNMSESELETLTYYLCHLLSRCSKSISYPAPTYYAHLAAFRARAHLADMKVDIINKAEESNKKFLIKDYFNTVPMFFV